ncbi:MAG: M14 family zinc carboxypeptidase [Fermentimonas sp.]
MNFRFLNGSVIGSRGPAISTDEGVSWRWIGDIGFSDTEFQYSFGPDENDVYFSQGMNYTEKDLKRFLHKYEHYSDLQLETLCISKKGRKVELLRILNRDNDPDFKVFLSARHHSGEMMASYALEGIIDVVLSDTEEGKWLRDHVDFFIVPFVDKDGVEDGDQGKNRHPHDHNRDYKLKIYPEIKAITMQVPKWIGNKPLFFLDMHCPWLRGGSDGDHPDKGNEFVFFTGNDPASDTGNFVEKLHRFSTILELSNKGNIPYKVSFNLLFGTSWNTAANRKSPDLQSSTDWGRTLPNAVFASSIEIPFANASGVVVDAQSSHELGQNLAIAIKIYLESLQ